MADFPRAGLDAGREALRRFLAGEDDLGAMHTKMALIATESIPACDIASITMLRGGKPTTLRSPTRRRCFSTRRSTTSATDRAWQRFAIEAWST